MKQLDLFSTASKTAIETDGSDLSVFGNDIVIEDETTVREPVLKPQEVSFKKGQYVRTRHGDIYFIDGLMPSQKVFAGYKTFKDRYGNPYQKTVYVNRERAYAYVMKNGKQVKRMPYCNPSLSLIWCLRVTVCTQWIMVISILSISR